MNLWFFNYENIESFLRKSFLYGKKYLKLIKFY